MWFLIKRIDNLQVKLPQIFALQIDSIKKLKCFQICLSLKFKIEYVLITKPFLITVSADFLWTFATLIDVCRQISELWEKLKIFSFFLKFCLPKIFKKIQSDIGEWARKLIILSIKYFTRNIGEKFYTLCFDKLQNLVKFKNSVWFVKFLFFSLAKK